MSNMKKKPISKKEKLRDKREHGVEKDRYKALQDVCNMHRPEARLKNVRDIA